MNSIRLIVADKYQSSWVVDDFRVDLSREPFIAAIDSIIDRLPHLFPTP